MNTYIDAHCEAGEVGLAAVHSAGGAPARLYKGGWGDLHIDRKTEIYTG